MALEFQRTMSIAASGMRLQGERLKVIAENLANAQSVGETPSDLPYRRKILTFRNEFDRAMGADLVKVKGIDVDQSDFKREHEPGHPAADQDGYVLYPNVQTVIELNDMREASRSYQANLSVIEMTRTMLNQTIQLLRR